MEQNHSELEDWVIGSLGRKKLAQNDFHELLTRLTIVIPSYQRQEFLLRQAVYWGHSGASIIIVDGSTEPLSERMRRAFAELPDFVYMHVKESFAERMKLAAELINTPYAAMLGDDEFFLKKGLCKAITRLDSDEQFIACCGQPVGFRYCKFGQSVEYFDSYTTYWRYEISEDRVQDRLRKAISTINSSTCYAVFRRDAWIEGWATLQPWSSPGALDIYQIIVTCIHGKLTSVDDVIWLRSSENSIITNEKDVHPAYDLKHTFQNWWSAARYANERDTFVSQLARSLDSHLRLSGEESRRVICDAVDIYLAICSRNQKLGPFRSWRNTVRAMISQAIRRFVSPVGVMALKQRLFWVGGRRPEGISGGSASGGIRFRGANAPNYDPAEFNRLESLILEFYETGIGSKASP